MPVVPRRMRDSIHLVGATFAGVMTAYGLYAAWSPMAVTLLWGVGCAIMGRGLVERLQRDASAA